MNLDVLNELPSPAEYRSLRGAAGWGELSEEIAQKALSSSSISICVRKGSKLVGFGRVVGDGVLYFYIADVFVDPAQRGQGLGDLIISTIIDRIREMAEPTATVAVLAAPGRESFYEKFGFERCPNKYFGDGMAFLEPIENFPV